MINGRNLFFEFLVKNWCWENFGHFWVIFGITYGWVISLEVRMGWIVSSGEELCWDKIWLSGRIRAFPYVSIWPTQRRRFCLEKISIKNPLKLPGIHPKQIFNQKFEKKCFRMPFLIRSSGKNLINKNRNSKNIQQTGKNQKEFKRKICSTVFTTYMNSRPFLLHVFSTYFLLYKWKLITSWRRNLK